MRKRNRKSYFKKPYVIFFIAFTMILCLLCKEINRRTSIPYASQVLTLGILLSFFSKKSFVGKMVNCILSVEGETILYIFIPILIFEQGFNSDLFLFRRNLKGILLLALPVVGACSILFGVNLWILGFGAKISFMGLLVIGAILGSTDPIAVGALLREMGTPEKVNMIIEGESLLNDGVSLVFVQVFQQIYLGKNASFFGVIFNFF